MITKTRLTALVLVAAAFTLTSLGGVEAGTRFQQFAGVIKHVPPLGEGWPRPKPHLPGDARSGCTVFRIE